MSSDKAKPIIIAVGVGALGTLLAYLGYNAIVDNNKEATINEETIGKSIEKTDGSMSDSSDDTGSEVKKTSFNKKDKKITNSVFFNFWKEDTTKKDVEKELLNIKINKEDENNNTNTENIDMNTENNDQHTENIDMNSKNKKTDYSKFYHN
tara:strand:+ start:1676 stop:2128 length:453 start_codon:yes stop_codon:yes gene_type:complete